MGFFQDILGGGGANTKAEQKKIAANAARTEQLVNLVQEDWQQKAREGAYDPNAQLSLLARDHEYGTKIGTQNMAAAARTLGYRPGDSEPGVKLNAFTQGNQLKYDQLANGIRNDAYERGSNAVGRMAGLGGSLLGQANSAYGNVAQMKVQDASQPSFFSTLLGAATPFLTPAPKAPMASGGGYTPSFSLGTTPYSQGGFNGGFFTTKPGTWGIQPDDLYADAPR